MLKQANATAISNNTSADAAQATSIAANTTSIATNTTSIATTQADVDANEITAANATAAVQAECRSKRS